MWQAILILSMLLAGNCLRGQSRAAQPGVEGQLSTGDILVAAEEMGDPNFVESVVLLVEYDPDKGTMGLLINRRSEIPLSRIFRNIKRAPSDPAYIGGPVEITIVQALLRAPESTEKAKSVLADIWVTGAKDLIEKSIAARTEASKFRVYLGYVGWGPHQLESELRVGAWSVVHQKARAVFDDDPDSLWSRLSAETHRQIARAEFQ